MPSDPNELAFLAGQMATGQAPPEPAPAPKPKPKAKRKNPAAVALGKLGGKKGGKARAAS